MTNPTLIDNELRYVIADEEVCARRLALLDAIVHVGNEPAGLSHTDFIPIAMKIKVTELIHRALDLGMSIRDPRWCLRDSGDVEVIIPFKQEVDAVMFRIMVL